MSFENSKCPKIEITTKEDSLNLLDLPREVIEEILNHLNLSDLRIFAVTSRLCHEYSKLSVELKSMLRIRQPLTLSQLRLLKRCGKHIKNVTIYNDNGFNCILKQLKYINVKPTKLVCNHEWTHDFIMNTLQAEPSIYSIELEESIDTASEKFPADVEARLAKPIFGKSAHNFVRKLRVHDYDRFEEIVNDFPNLEYLQLSFPRYKPQSRVNNAQEVCFKELRQLNTLKVTNESFPLTVRNLEVFKGLTTLIFESVMFDYEFIQKLLDNNKETLKHLDIEIHSSYMDELVIPCQLKTMRTFSDDHCPFEHLLEGQQELESLTVDAFITQMLLTYLESNTSITTFKLETSRLCQYQEEQLTRSYIKGLSNIKHFIFQRCDDENEELLETCLTQMDNLETLEIIDLGYNEPTFVMENSKVFPLLKNVSLTKCTIEILNGITKYLSFPNIEKLSVFGDDADVKSSLLEMLHAKCTGVGKLKLECELANEDTLEIFKNFTKLEEFEFRIASTSFDNIEEFIWKNLIGNNNIKCIRIIVSDVDYEKVKDKIDNSDYVELFMDFDVESKKVLYWSI